ncbi:NYN domain-containing protein [Paenibacillus aestuarii]|uniref:NYN domain-containing protein n=1 Tax=Paenibacillus aestuarii TaxID=516965 RepID=A0ABW0K8P3_9BACL|nr:NYN domain-containing protein [Paenibacillus aestuarii]
MAIYVDYDNLYKRLKSYNIHPVRDLNFFQKLTEKFRNSGHDVIKFISFANFEDSDFEAVDQTKIHNFGVDVRHCSLDGKSSTDIEMTVEMMRDLYKDARIEAFVIISNDRDYIPVVKSIKAEGKITYTLTTKNGVSSIVNVFSDYHQFLEDLFDIFIDISAFDEKDILSQKAFDVSSFFYKSKFWERFRESGSPVTLRGYAIQLKRTFRDSQSNIEHYFHHAHILKYIEIVEIEGVKYLRGGSRIHEFISEDDKSVAL